MDWLQAAQGMIRQGAPCLFRLVTGLYCPGCGGTRALKAFLRGDLILSFLYHPLIVYAAAAAGAEILSWLLSRAAKNPRLYLGHVMGVVYGGVALILINWVVKNVLLIQGGGEVLPPWPY